MFKNVHGALFVIETKIETIQMSINRELAVQILVYLYSGELCSRSKD